MRPLEQQVILVTGATDGLGKELAAELAGAGATLLLHGLLPPQRPSDSCWWPLPLDLSRPILHHPWLCVRIKGLTVCLGVTTRVS